MFKTEAEAEDFGQNCSGEDFYHLIKLKKIYLGRLMLSSNNNPDYEKKIDRYIELLEIAIDFFNDNQTINWNGR